MIFPVVKHGCESWTIKKTTPKNRCFQTMVLEKTPQSPLDCKENKPVNLKGDQPSVLTGRTDAEVKLQLFWPSEATDDSLENFLMLGKIEGRREEEIRG